MPAHASQLYMLVCFVILMSGSRAVSQAVEPETHILARGVPLAIDAGLRDITVTWTDHDTLALDPLWADFSDPAIYLRMKLPPRVRSFADGKSLEGDFQKTDGTWHRYFSLPLDNDASNKPTRYVSTRASAKAATPPAPSLINGDFSLIGAQNWINRPNNKDYLGGPFKYQLTTATGWSAYKGTGVEVWTGGDSQGSFIELDAAMGSYGIKQPIKNAVASGYALLWKELGRNNPASNTNRYYVKIYYVSQGNEVEIAKLTPSRNAATTQWQKAAFSFNITEDQLKKAAGAPIQVAFIPEDNNAYGCLIDDVKIIPIDIKEVISDQILGNEANKLPTSFYGGHPNNPMLMGTRMGTDARLMIKMNVLGAYAASIRVGVRQKGQTTILNSSACIAPPGKTPLSFTAIDGTNIYELVAGYDANSNSILDQSEAKVIFQKTPKINRNGIAYNGKDSTFELIDKILVVTKDDYNKARVWTQSYDTTGHLTHRTGSALMGMFATGATSVPGVSSTTTGHILDANIIPSPQGLSHPLGAKWNASNKANTFTIVFPATSQISQKLQASRGLVALRERILVGIKAQLLPTATAKEKTSAPIPFSDDRIDFARSERLSDLHLALGKCRAAGTITVKYSSSIDGTNLHIHEYKIDGYVNDLYDWAYGTSLVIPIYGQIDLTKDAAKTQAGHATLTDPATPDAGRVFFTNVEIKTGWKSLGVTY